MKHSAGISGVSGGGSKAGTVPGLRPAPSGRASPRRSDDDRLLDVAGRLTERDRVLCRLLHSHRVLTTAQIADVGFAGRRRAEKRLAELHSWTVLDRFRPRLWSGSAPYHWLLGSAGAALLAAEAGLTPAQFGWRRDSGIALAQSQRLAHLLGVNGVFTALIGAAGRRPGCELAAWWSEARCAAEWGELVRPDGYGVWVAGGQRLPFLLEYDTGSERLARLAGKLPGYADLHAASGHQTWVCFTFPSPGREATARPVLTHPAVPVATAVLPAGIDPSGPVWLPVGPLRGMRLALADLGDPQHSLNARNHR